MKKLFVLLVSCALAGAAGKALANDVEAEFARVDKDAFGQPRSLQLAVVTYAPRALRPAFTVDLISAVHIGDRDYYRELNERFRDYDALLFELVVSGPQADDGGQPDFDASFLSRIQIDMKDALGLAFQLEEIDYTAPNFVHADLTSALLQERMAERGESLYVYFWRLVYASVEEVARDPLGLNDLELAARMLSDPEDDAFKTAIAYEMVAATARGDFLGDENGSAIIAARNEHALAVLRQQLDDGARRIGIFYGAAHMRDFDERLLQDFGLQRVGVDWVDAWQLARTPRAD